MVTVATLPAAKLILSKLKVSLTPVSPCRCSFGGFTDGFPVMPFRELPWLVATAEEETSPVFVKAEIEGVEPGAEGREVMRGDGPEKDTTMKVMITNPIKLRTSLDLGPCNRNRLTSYPMEQDEI